MKGIIWGHEVHLEGYNIYNWSEEKIPDVITIFSAPNYCNRYGNLGAILYVKKNGYDIH